MLKNPNLSLEKMFEVMTFGKDIIGYSLLLLVVLLLYLYRYEIRLFFKYGLSKDSKGGKLLSLFGIIKTDCSKLEREDLNNKVEDLINELNNSSVDMEIQMLEDGTLSKKSNKFTPPSFRSLKTVRNLNVITYHFLNDGGAIYDFSTKNSVGIKIYFSNENRIETNASGYIKFKLPKKFKQNNFAFTLTFYDKIKNHHQINFSYSLTENKLL